jgi:hypothetical protein
MICLLEADDLEKASALVDLPAVELPPELWIFLKVLTMFRQLSTGVAFHLFESSSGGFLGIAVFLIFLATFLIGLFPNIGSEFRSLTEFLFWQLRRKRLIALIPVLDVVGFSVAVPLWRRP